MTALSGGVPPALREDEWRTCETHDHYVREHIQRRATPRAIVCVTYAAGTGGSDRAHTQHVCRMHDETDRHDAVARVRLPRHLPDCRDYPAVR